MTDGFADRERVSRWYHDKRLWSGTFCGIALLAFVWFVVKLKAQYDIEQRFACHVERLSGDTHLAYDGPDWLPVALRRQLPIWDRVCICNLVECSEVDEILVEARQLQCLEEMRIMGRPANRIDFTKLAMLKPLTELWLEGVGEVDIHAICKLDRLTLLSASGNHIGDDDVAMIATLPRLRRLYLDGNPITDAALQYLAPMDTLLELSLGNTLTTIGGQNWLRGKLPCCTIECEP